MATAVPVIQGGTDTIDQISKLLAALNPLFGGGTTRTSGGTTTNNESASIGGEAGAQSNELLQKIMGDSNGTDIDNMVQSILAKAKNEFGQQSIESNAAGVRGYSDTVKAQLQNDAMAKATAQAAQAKLGALNEANRTAASLVSAKMTNTRSVQQAQTRPGTATSTGATNLGKVTSLLGGAAAARSLLNGTSLGKKLGIGKTPAGPEQLSGPPEDPSSLMTDQAFGASPDGGISISGLTAGGDPNALLVPGRAASAALTPAVVDPELAPMVAADGTLAPAATTTPVADQNQPQQQPLGPNVAIDPSMVVTPDTSATTDILAAQGITPGTAMPAAGTGTPMPPAIFDPTAMNEAEAVDVIPSDLSASVDFGNLIGGAGTDLAAEGAIDAAAGSTPYGAIYSIANLATEGELTKSVMNLPVVGGPITDAATATNDFAMEGMQGGEDFLQNAEDVVGSIAGGCFITTAATLGGELDQGFTLTALRNFRDEYMLQDPQRRADLLEYYAVAPEIVARINESNNADNIWSEIRLRYLVPAVVAYVTGNNEKAYEIYTKMVGFAKGVH